MEEMNNLFIALGPKATRLLVDKNLSKITISNKKIKPTIKEVKGMYEIVCGPEFYCDISYTVHKYNFKIDYTNYKFHTYTNNTVMVDVEHQLIINTDMLFAGYSEDCMCEMCNMVDNCDCSECGPCINHNTYGDSAIYYADFKYKIKMNIPSDE